MRVWMQESQRFIVERTKGTDALSVAEMCHAMQVMPNGFGVMAIENRSDGTTVVHLQAISRRQVALPK